MKLAGSMAASARFASRAAALLTVMAGVAILAGCQNTRRATAPGDVFNPPPPNVAAPGSQSGRPPPVADIPGLMSPDEFRAQLVGKTWMSYEPRHGTQIIYIREDGRAFLWYPGNRIILPSRWAITERRDSFVYDHPDVGRTHSMELTAAICFQYAGTSANPVTRNSTGLECITSNSWRRVPSESRPGDVLGLATMTIPPFPLPKDKTTFPSLLQRTKQAPRQ